MEQILTLVGAFTAGFLIGNLTKVELRTLVRKMISWAKNRRKR